MQETVRGSVSVRVVVSAATVLVSAAAVLVAGVLWLLTPVNVVLAEGLSQLPHTGVPPTEPPGLPSTVQPGTPMVPPTSRPTDAPPPTSGPPQPTRPPRPTRTLDTGGGDEGGVGQPTAPPTATVGESPGGPPTRTRRPTRTPRTTATPSPTPMVAGGMRLTLSADPPVLIVGQLASLRLVLANRMDRPAGNITLQVIVPSDVLVDKIHTRVGHTARDGELVRWFVPILPAGESAELKLEGVLGIGRPGGIDLCVTILSAGAPVEQCVVFDTTVPAAAPELPTGSPTPITLDMDITEEEPIRVSRTTMGWLLVIVGMGAVGLLIGDRLRRRGKTPADIES